MPPWSCANCHNELGNNDPRQYGQCGRNKSFLTSFDVGVVASFCTPYVVTFVSQDSVYRYSPLPTPAVRLLSQRNTKRRPGRTDRKIMPISCPRKEHIDPDAIHNSRREKLVSGWLNVWCDLPEEFAVGLLV